MSSQSILTCVAAAVRCERPGLALVGHALAGPISENQDAVMD